MMLSRGSSASVGSKPLLRHQRASRGPRRVVVTRAAGAAPRCRREEKSDAPPVPPPPKASSPLREAARRAAAASAAAALSASALFGAPALDAAAAAVDTPPPALSTSSTAAAAATTTTTTKTTFRLPVVSPDPDVLSVQRVLLQAWDIVDRAFVDGSFGGRGQGPWRGDLVDSLDAAAGAGAAGGGGGGGARLAELAIDAMLERLGDPYTRRMPARDYEAFRQSSEGEIAGGVGLLIAAQPVVKGDEEDKVPLPTSTSAAHSSPSPSPSSSSSSSASSSSSLSNSTRLRSRLVVLSPIEGGPAARAGIRPGDEVLAIDGHPTDGLGGESAAGMLRGPRGSSVVVDVARREVEEGTGGEAAVPGIPGRAPRPPQAPLSSKTTGGAAATAPRVSIRQVRLRREKVELSPVTSAVLLPVDDGQQKNGSSFQQQRQQLQRPRPQAKVGYLRLASFSARAAPDTARALRQLRSEGAEALVLDLRGNGGGLVRAAVDVSRALLPRGSTIFAVQGRSNGDGGDGGDDGDGDAALLEHGGGEGEGDETRGGPRRRHGIRGLGAMTPPASPLDVVSASSGIPSTAITQRVVLDGDGDDIGEQEGAKGGAVFGRKKKTPSSSSSSLSGSSLPSPAISSTTPLAVLVDRDSASASEILAGALSDNGRALLVGERTFGKGKIQSVFPLRDGSALFVTVARYMTPSEQLIDGVGISPENACLRGGSGRGGGRASAAAASASASTLLASLEMVPGVAREAGALQASLSADSCVLTAERLLLAQVEKQQQEQQDGGTTRGGERRL